MLKGVIKGLLLKIVDDLEVGNSNISEEDAMEVIKTLRYYTRKDTEFSRYTAAKYLNVCPATFDNYVKSGKIVKGEKRQGRKELTWLKKDLDEFINKERSK